MRNVEAAGAGLLDQVESLGKFEGLGFVTVNLNLNAQLCQLYILAKTGRFRQIILLGKASFRCSWRALRLSGKTYDDKTGDLDEDAAVAEAGHGIDGVGLMLDILEGKVL